MPLSLRQDLSHQKVNFLDDSNFPSRRHCGSPSFLTDSSVQEQGMCAPVSQTTTSVQSNLTPGHTEILPGILILGGHLSLKRLGKITSLFMTNEHSHTPAARASQNGSEEKEEMNGQDYGFFARYSLNTDLSPNQ